MGDRGVKNNTRKPMETTNLIRGNSLSLNQEPGNLYETNLGPLNIVIVVWLGLLVKLLTMGTELSLTLCSALENVFLIWNCLAQT